MAQNEPETVRLDRWLNYACLYKTRARAARACEERRIKVNGQVAKPAKTVQPGDLLTIKKKSGQYVELEILKIVRGNVSHAEARTLYDQKRHELSREAAELMELLGESFRERRPKYKGRPTKKERRRLERVKKRRL